MGGFKVVNTSYTGDNIYSGGRDVNNLIIQWLPNTSRDFVISESQKWAELGSPLTGLNTIVCDGGCLSELAGSSFARMEYNF